jgi:hypothetical protein
MLVKTYREMCKYTGRNDEFYHTLFRRDIPKAGEDGRILIENFQNSGKDVEIDFDETQWVPSYREVKPSSKYHNSIYLPEDKWTAKGFSKKTLKERVERKKREALLTF